jgi:H+-transporting ATPase
MIIIAAVLSAVLRHWPDLGVIVALLLLNAIVGFREEHQAGNVIAALKKKLAVLAKVKRDGAWVSIPSRELVPGDVVRVRIGDIVPADARLFDGEPVEVDQSALTGESLPVEHKSGDAVYSGSIIKRGEIESDRNAKSSSACSHQNRKFPYLHRFSPGNFDINGIPFTA